MKETPVLVTLGQPKGGDSLRKHKKRNTPSKRRQLPKLTLKRVMAWLGVLSGLLTVIKLLAEILQIFHH